MCNIHAMEIIPSQASINSIATYRTEFDNESLNYNELLKNLRNTVHKLEFMNSHNTTEWMQKRGIDYFTNPKLFVNAPLTCLCAFLGELFNRYELEELQARLPPDILKSALTRLEQFTDA